MYNNTIYFLSIVCSVETYSDVINGPCELCPANSEANVTGLSVCPCIQNYYRATDEELVYHVPVSDKYANKLIMYHQFHHR